MPRSIPAFLPALLIAGAISLAVPASALAQSPPAMPMPPSAGDPLPKETAPAKAKPAPRKRARSDAAAPARTRGGDESLSERIDTRPARGGGIELEDDPRAVQPTLQNGRAGVGMRF